MKRLKKHVFKPIQNQLNAQIDNAIASGDAFVHGDKDFSRNRKLSPHALIRMVYEFTDQSVSRFIPFASSIPASFRDVSPSAVCQAFGKIRPDIFKKIFFRFNSACFSDGLRLFKGHQLLAVDGSEVYVGPNRKDPDKSKGKSKKSGKRHFYHLNAEYDVLNHFYTNAIVQPGSEKNEDSALIELTLSARDLPIYIADRGYEALMTFYRFIQKGILFVIRIKDEDSSTSILRHYPTPDEDEYDIDFDVILTNKNNFHVKAHWDTYKYISHYKKEPEFDGSVHELELHGRVVRYTAVSEGKETHFTVLTNLSRNQFSTEDIREIYHLRWQEEISFRDLKHKIDLDTVHFRKLERIEAEIFAKLTVYNLMSCVRNALEKRINKAEKRRKYEYRIDFAFLTDVCRAYLFRKRIPANLDHLLLSRQQPVRPGRSDRRKKR